MNLLRKPFSAFVILFVLAGFILPAGQMKAHSEPISAGPSLLLDDGTTQMVDLINQDRTQDRIAVYTRKYGEKTKPFDSATVEYIVSGNTVVVINTKGLNGTNIPTKGFVVSVPAAGPFGKIEIGQKLTPANMEEVTLPPNYIQIGGLSVGIDRFNDIRGESEVVLFQPSYGSSTHTNPWGLEFTIVNDQVTHVVSVSDQAANSTLVDNDSLIPAQGYVISIHTSSPYFARLDGKLKVGDSAKLVLSQQEEGVTYKVIQTGYDELNSPIRDLDKMVVYDSSFGKKTDTNSWGNEVTVDARGVVIRNGGNNSDIPEGGHVISGVGTTAAWLSVNAKVGATVRIDQTRKQITVVYTPESYLNKAEIMLENAKAGLQVSKQRYLDVPYSQIESEIASARSLLEQARSKVDSGDYSGLISLLGELDQKAEDTLFMNYESRKVETRGVWRRPTETSLEQVKETLDKIAGLHINSIYLETWWDGFTIYPSQSKDTELNPIYEGFDVMKAYIVEGKKRGIEIHAWVQNFYVGQGHTSPVYDDHPEWTMLSRSGRHYSMGSDRFRHYFFNPALPEAREFVLSVYKELVKKYDLAGLHLDFVRYPESGDYTNDFSYDPYTRDLFKKKYKVDPIDLFPGDDLWEKWNRFRIDIINSFVDKVATEIVPLRPGMKLTAAVWPDYESSPQNVLQETKNWTNKKYMDNIFQMSYVPDAALLEADVNNSLNLMNYNGFVTSGIATNLNFTKSSIVEQVDAAYRFGASGASLFECESLFENGYDHDLRIGIYRNEAIMPDYATTKPLYTILEEIARKTNEVYVPLNGMNQNDADEISQGLLDELSKYKTQNKMNREIVLPLKEYVMQLGSKVRNHPSIDAEVKNRMIDDMHRAIKIMDIYLSKTRGKTK
ncbi:glycoside hydrolase family 10 protein [Cohnella yongneupensis]|uniref:Glycoside hydrolase family 10 protein n=1 Tax=Cohnella yongneupensis TaxID=425006 RepID=A0ABW0QVG8_9BACL